MIIGGLAIIRDISERKHAEAELRNAKAAAEAANRAKSTFLANMSHELRTPLTAIFGYTALIDLEATTVVIRTCCLICSHPSGRQHLIDLITDILDLWKIEAGKMNLDLETFDLAALIEDMSDNYSAAGYEERE